MNVVDACTLQACRLQQRQLAWARRLACVPTHSGLRAAIKRLPDNWHSRLSDGCSTESIMHWRHPAEQLSGVASALHAVRHASTALRADTLHTANTTGHQVQHYRAPSAV